MENPGDDDDQEKEEEEEEEGEEEEHQRTQDQDCSPCLEKNIDTTELKRKKLGLSCILNTEVGAVLAVLRRIPESNSPYMSPSEDYTDPEIVHSLKSLRALIFNPQQEWRMIDPSVYFSPFLEVIQGDNVQSNATEVALSALHKIFKLDMFDEKTPGAKAAINSVVAGIMNCRLEKCQPTTRDEILMRILQLLNGLLHSRASTLLNDKAICTIVTTYFQVVRRTASRGNLLQREAKYAVHELIQIIFSRLPEMEAKDGENSESDTEDADIESNLGSGYGVRCLVDIFHFLCSLLNAIVETDGSVAPTADEDIQVFSMVLINSAIELSGDGIAKHPDLLRMIQNDLFHYLIHYGTSSSPLIISMICSIVLNVYHSLRRYIRLQLEAFFTFVLFRIAVPGTLVQIQEIAVEGIITFCRQPTFTIETYINYDCDPMFQNLFEEIGKLLCKHAFPTGSPFTSLQIQAFEGLVATIHSIADNIEKEEKSSFSGPYSVDITEYRPIWEEKSKEDCDLGTWVDFVRTRKVQKRKMMIAGNHFNLDVKKGLEYLKASHLVSDPADPKVLAFFFRNTPRLDKNMIGDYLGDPAGFNIQVLKEFTETFDFSGMILDTALRTFLETFRLPGESQKIQRILEAFSDKFYVQQPSQLFVSKDAVFIFCYSLIMLNTDLHNPQVKKKMTEEEFIRNNRAINGGKDLPREYLSEFFHSISNNAITLFSQSGLPIEMNPNKWIELINRSKVMHPFIACDFDHRLGRDMFASIAGPSVAALSAIFEHADDEEILHECIEGLLSVARIARYGLEDTLDEVLSLLCKFTTLLNPHASAEEILYVFSNDMKPRMAILAVFTIANTFECSIQGGWRNIVDCLLKLKRLKLLPQSIVEPNATTTSTSDLHTHTKSESGIIFPSHDPKFGDNRCHHSSGIIGQFSHFLSMESMEDSLTQGGSELEQNLKTIQQCRIGNIFAKSCNLPDESLQNLGRSLIFAAAGKGQKFSTPIEEEETIGFCWDLVTTIALANSHRFPTFWPSYHDYLLAVAQFPLFSSIPFAEKAIVSFFKVCIKLLTLNQPNKFSEELIFKSINLMWKLEKEILDTCCEFITQSVSKILTEHPANLQSQLGWKSTLHLLSITGRHPETYDQAVETLITLMSDGTYVSQANYPYHVDCAFGFVALKSSPLEKATKILDLMSDSVNWLVQWNKSGYADPGSNMISNVSSSFMEDNSRGFGLSNLTVSLFVKLGEALRKASLARREEIRNHAILALQRSFTLAEELCFTSTNCINCFNLVIFAMVDDLHEKMLEYSRREDSEREIRSMEGTLKIAMELLTDVFLQFLRPISGSPGFRTFWLGVLRRMDTCMKADLGEYGDSELQALIPEWLRKMITTMKEKGILSQREGEDLWDITHIQIQWIAPSLKEELFPEEM